MMICKKTGATQEKMGWDKGDDSWLKTGSMTSCWRTCSLYCLRLRGISLICMCTSCTCVCLCLCKAVFTLPLTKTSHYQMWRGGEDGKRRGSTYYRPWDQSHQRVLKKKEKKSALLHSRDEQYAVMMLTQVWSMCTFPPQSACLEREVCVCGCFILRRSVHNKQSDRGLQRELKYTKALRKCLNNVA